MSSVDSSRTKSLVDLASVVIWGIAPVVALAVRFDVALWFSLITATILVLTAIFLFIVRDMVNATWLLAFTLVCSGFLVTISEILLALFAPNLLQNMGVFLPVLAVSPMVLAQIDNTNQEMGLAEHLLGALRIFGPFVILMVLVGLVREILADGRLTVSIGPDRPVQLVIPGLSDSPVGFLASAAGGLIMIGFILAFGNWLRDHKPATNPEPLEKTE